jgi:hypothetical protein
VGVNFAVNDVDDDDDDDDDDVVVVVGDIGLDN